MDGFDELYINVNGIGLLAYWYVMNWLLRSNTEEGVNKPAQAVFDVDNPMPYIVYTSLLSWFKKVALKLTMYVPGLKLTLKVIGLEEVEAEE